MAKERYHNKTATSDRLDLCWHLGFQWHRRGTELVFKSLDCFTKWLFHSVTFFFAATYVFVVWNFTRLITRLKSFFLFFLTSIWWGSTQLQCIYYLRRILISRPPRVFRRFKRRSCPDCNRVARSGKNQGNSSLSQSQGKVREFCCKSGTFVICYQSQGKVREFRLWFLSGHNYTLCITKLLGGILISLRPSVRPRCFQVWNY